MSIIPDGQQLIALDKIEAWFENPAEQVFKLGGYAGSGKSSLAPNIIRRLYLNDQEVLFCAFTNKAGDVLEAKLRGATPPVYSPVTTIHKLLKTSREVHCDICPRHNKEDRLALCTCKSRSGCGCGLVFEDRQFDGKPPKLIICDEASMVARDLYDDLLAMAPHIKVLFIGDPAQLKPIDSKSRGFSPMADADYVLSEYRRFNQASPLADVARQVRETGKLKFGEYGDGVMKVSRDDPKFLDLIDPNDWVAITKFRQMPKDGPTESDPLRNVPVGILNGYFRDSMGRGKDPEVGDKVTAVSIDPKKHKISKWTIGYVTEFQAANEHLCKLGVNIPGYSREYLENVQRNQFNYLGEPLSRRYYDLWDFGYAITCECAQGSEYPNVVVFEPTRNYRYADYRHWLYTAVTRAQQRLIVVE